MKELYARIKYNFFCLVMKDDSWDMGADLCGGVFPLSGQWVNMRGTYDKFKDAV